MRKNGLDLRVLLSLLVLVVVAGGVALLAIGGSSALRPSTRRRAQPTSTPRRCSQPAAPAPPLALHNYLGQPVNIDSYRGKAVLVTFLYTNCPDVCPLITSNLRVALNLMGAATAAESADHRRLGGPARATRRRPSRRSSRATR